MSLVLSETRGIARIPWARERRATAENFMLVNGLRVYWEIVVSAVVNGD